MNCLTDLKVGDIDKNNSSDMKSDDFPYKGLLMQVPQRFVVMQIHYNLMVIALTTPPRDKVVLDMLLQGMKNMNSMARPTLLQNKI